MDSEELVAAESAFVLEMQRDFVSSKVEQLKTLMSQNAILAGFGATFIVQVPIPTDSSSPTEIIILFGGVSSIVVCLFLLSLFLCAHILLCIQNFDCIEASKNIMTRHGRNHSASFSEQINSPIDPSFKTKVSNLASVESFWSSRCASDFLLAFRFFLLGIPLLFFNVVLCGVVQFRWYRSAYIAVTVVSGIALFGYLLAVGTWRNAVNYRNVIATS